MHYRDLYITHRAFWSIERRAKYYESYMKQAKDWKKWPESVDLFEIKKLLDFIVRWDMHLRMKSPKSLYEVYEENRPIIVGLKSERLEDTDLNGDLTKQISYIFDKVAPCSIEAYESTDCSKILHTILPHLIVMWDMKIRAGILGDENKKSGAIYALEFLPQMQIELREAIATCMDEKGLSREEAIKYIREICGYESLPKLVDEHNYVIYTRRDEFKPYLETLNKKNEIKPEEYIRLMKRLQTRAKQKTMW